jgi:hypothetical protein
MQELLLQELCAVEGKLNEDTSVIVNVISSGSTAAKEEAVRALAFTQVEAISNASTTRWSTSCAHAGHCLL